MVFKYTKKNQKTLCSEQRLRTQWVRGNVSAVALCGRFSQSDNLSVTATLSAGSFFVVRDIISVCHPFAGRTAIPVFWRHSPRIFRATQLHEVLFFPPKFRKLRKSKICLLHFGQLPRCLTVGAFRRPYPVVQLRAFTIHVPVPLGML